MFYQALKDEEIELGDPSMQEAASEEVLTAKVT